MIFTEFRYGLFFAVAFLVHWSLRTQRSRKVWLLACSYAFYGAWDWRFLGLIMFSTVLDYSVGLGLLHSDHPVVRKRWLLASLIGNVGLLWVFKYYNFFVDTGLDFLHYLGLPAEAPFLDVALPVGISFYTFQTLSYSIDAYRRLIEPTRNALDIALFVAFFPQLVAGPIMRAVDFLPQLRTRRSFREIDVRACLVLFLVGFFKKAVVSDFIAIVVEDYYAAPEAYSAFSCWVACLLFTAQVYLDFSAYTDMAIASAGLLGYNLCINFRFPYFATNISDVWRRWHVSLSSWLRDYIYIPLGGNQSSEFRIARSLMITMVLAGLWHGAAGHFAVFGVLMGAALFLRRVWAHGYGRRIRIPAFLCWAITYYFVCATWILFHGPDTATSFQVMRIFLTMDSPGSEILGERLIWVWLVLAAIHWIAYRKWIAEWWRKPAGWTFTGLYGVSWALVISLIDPQAEPFIYFQF